jgi:hypothetical protein
MTTFPRVLVLHTVHEHATITFSAGKEGASRPREGDYLLFYPRWYSVDLEGILQGAGTSCIPRRHADATALEDWQVDLETVLDLPLDQALQPFQCRLDYTVFFDPGTISVRRGDLPMWFPPHAYVHLEPFLYHTDAQGWLHHLGTFSAHMADNADGFIERFWSLTRLDRSTPILSSPKEGTNQTIW